MKRANSTGCIRKLSGKRRRPWAVLITTGYTDEGKQIREYKGYFETKREASQYLDHLFLNPDESDMTVAQAWEGWQRAFQGTESTISAYRSGYKRLAGLYNMKLRDLTLPLMQSAVDQPPRTYSTAKTVKKVLSALLDYGFSHDACPASRRALLQYIVMPEQIQKDKSVKRFTDEEIQDAIDSQCVLAVVLIFTGLRLHELMGLTLDDIDLESQQIHVRKSKTPAGIRTVPVPDRLVPWIRRYIEAGSLGRSKTWLEHNLWSGYPLHGHVRHDCRHTYISILTEAGTDERLLKALCGHAGGVTADVYTHYTPERQLEAVNLAFMKYLPAITDDGPDYSERILA